MAQRNNWVSYGTQRARGLSEFLNELSREKLIDNRPPNIVRRHEEEARYGRAPTWTYVRQRRARLLTLNEDTIVRYFKVAYEVGITRAEPWPIGGPDMKTPYPSVAFVLEGIGLEWIIPKMGEYPRGKLRA